MSCASHTKEEVSESNARIDKGKRKVDGLGTIFQVTNVIASVIMITEKLNMLG